MFPSLATLVLRASMSFSTKTWKGPPMTVKKTFASHYLGSLGRSRSSGRKAFTSGCQTRSPRMVSQVSPSYWGTKKTFT